MGVLNVPGNFFYIEIKMKFHQEKICEARKSDFSRASLLYPWIIFFSLSQAMIFSVFMLPTSSSCAMGQPPIPFKAPSILLTPEFTAAASLGSKLGGEECKCTPKLV